MAKYQINYKCGHSGEVQLFGKHEDRYRKIEWLEANCNCPDCERKEYEEYSAKAAEDNKGLVKLTGTPKQIQWAEVIRSNAIKSIDELKSELNAKVLAMGAMTDEHKQVYNQICETLESFLANNNSSWWIDNREHFDSLKYLMSFVKQTINSNH